MSPWVTIQMSPFKTRSAKSAQQDQATHRLLRWLSARNMVWIGIGLILGIGKFALTEMIVEYKREDTAIERQKDLTHFLSNPGAQGHPNESVQNQEH